MKTTLLIISDVTAALIAFSIILYAPLAKNRRRALIVPAVITFIWGVTRTLSITIFREQSPPLIGFVIAPFLSMFFAAAARGLLRGLLGAALRRLGLKVTRSGYEQAEK